MTPATSPRARAGRIVAGDGDLSDVPTGSLMDEIVAAASAGIPMSYQAVQDAASGPLKADDRRVPRAERYRSGKNPKDGMR